jgi:hypothetical protein
MSSTVSDQPEHSFVMPPEVFHVIASQRDVGIQIHLGPVFQHDLGKSVYWNDTRLNYKLVSLSIFTNLVDNWHTKIYRISS